jgi:cyclic beta-1,2-glucan synthetase
LAGLPRVYGVAWAFVAHTDGAFDEELAQRFLGAYQETRELNLAEMWALPTTLRVVLIESLRRLAERVAANKAARELANLCSDRIESFSIESLDELLAQLEQRGVGPAFLGQVALRLQDSRPPPSRMTGPATSLAAGQAARRGDTARAAGRGPGR